MAKPKSTSIPVALAKIHRATVTWAVISHAKVTLANLDYVGSITIDSDLLAAAGLQQYQMVHVNNVRNGAHWETYILEGPAGKGDICLNGPPAHHFQPSDLVIIVAYAQMDPADVKKHAPVVVFVDKNNKITGTKSHRDIPLGATGLPKAKKSK